MIQQSTNIKPSQQSLALVATGPDACKFLQGQLTCDIAALDDGQSTLGAYCNIKGKVESLFTLIRVDETYNLYTQQDLLQPTIQELQKYAVFSKVKLALIEQPPLTVDEEQQILAKIPALYPQTVGLFFPHDLNLPELGAVSFSKGCYRGQEIVARMQHRGNLKRSLYLFRSPKMQFRPGDIINSTGGNHAGTVVRSCIDSTGQCIGLAVITNGYVNDLIPGLELF